MAPAATLHIFVSIACRIFLCFFGRELVNYTLSAYISMFAFILQFLVVYLFLHTIIQYFSFSFSSLF